MKIIDKVILGLLAIEHLGFGFYGLFAPESIAELVGYELLSNFSFSEIRANYALFTVLGFLALISIYYNNLAKGTYFVYIVIFASFQLLNQEFHSIGRAHRRENAAQDPHFRQGPCRHQELFLTRARFLDIDRRKRSFVG